MPAPQSVQNALNGINIKELPGDGHTKNWGKMPNAKLDLIEPITERIGFSPPTPHSLAICILWGGIPPASWSVFSLANPSTMVHMSFWGVPHALHSMTVNFCLISQSPSPLPPEAPILSLGGDSWLKGHDSSKNYWMDKSASSQHAFQCVLIAINVVRTSRRVRFVKILHARLSESSLATLESQTNYKQRDWWML